jgi:hypothetical protein
MRKRKTPNIRAGDAVRVVTPEAFVRCGYPLAFEDVAAAVRKDHGEAVSLFLVGVGVHFPPHGVPRAVDKVVKAIAYEHLRQAGYGGRERRVYTRPLPGLAGQTRRVAGVRFVKTGTYSPGRVDYWGEHYPAFLENEQTRRILLLDGPGWADDRDYWHPLEIDAENVEVVAGG